MAIVIPFLRVESIGNDFNLVDLDEFVDENAEFLALQMCDRMIGVGGDGLLALARSGSGLKLRMFNPDGTEDFCGNGLRCAAKVAIERGWVGDEFVIEHKGREVKVRVDGDLISTEIGKASYLPQDIPVAFKERPEQTYQRPDIYAFEGHTMMGSALSTGSTHVVMAEGLPRQRDFKFISRHIERDPQFPEGTSVIWREVVKPGQIRIRIWERGVGETLGCGTGSSAAAVETMRDYGWTEEVLVENPGGSVIVEAESWDAPLTLTGDAKILSSEEFELIESY